MFQIRNLNYDDILECREIVASHWGDKVANNAAIELNEMFGAARWPPLYHVATIDDKVVAFSGFRSSWIMSGVYELIWINVAKEHGGKGIGKALTQHRLDYLEKIGASLVLLMTQKPDFFIQFGFNSIAIFDGWCLMTKQLNPVKIGYDP